MTQELYKRYRPKTFSDVIGQEHITKALQKMIEKKQVPHTILFCGPKGCGKTSLGRLLRKALDCSKWDFVEQNCANKRGIDSIREIERTMNLRPMKGTTKIWIFDEAHQWSTDAQDALLKILEDTPSHVYFIICTTDPQKLKATIKSRCTQFGVKPLNADSLKTLLTKVSKAEKLKISDDVLDKIAENSDNSARNALVLLDKIQTLDDEEEQLDAINKASTETAAIQIARTLMNPKVKWPEMAKVLKETEQEDAESMRWMILGYASAVLVGAGPLSSRAYNLIQIFRDNFYDSKTAGLRACCYEAVVGN